MSTSAGLPFRHSIVLGEVVNVFLNPLADRGTVLLQMALTIPSPW